MKYVNLVIDNKSNSTDNFFTYACEMDEIKLGDKVKVSFGKSKKLRDAYVAELIEDEATIYAELKNKLKFVEEIDENISLTEEMMRTCLWMKNRYLCRYIDAIKCFLPAWSNRKRKPKEDSNIHEEENSRTVIENLNDQQEEAFVRIKSALDGGKHDRFLIHGVTGSGKTEVYIKATQEAVETGRGVIILVPEISLTSQITERFLAKFGKDSVAIMHSKISQADRYNQWLKIRNGEIKIVIGARSAVFAPIKKLGLVIIDEEHESTYKSEFSPKYDTVEVALKRLNDRDNNGVLVLGSATPSVVTYNRAKEGIYKLIKLTKRYNAVPMPQAEIVDMRNEMKDGNKLGISRVLADEMEKQMACGKQILLFLNRRGYATFVSCRECGYVAKCPVCGLSLTYHKNAGGGKLACHFCGYETSVPNECPDCGSKYIKYFGSGTEKIEETIKELFEDKVIDRIDLDTIKAKGELNRKLKAFEKGKTNILIGTQLIAKGLDFKNVGLVGIISADVALNIPDFRSSERAFQLITQAAGRAGRGDQVGKVIIQTYSPEHYAIVMAAAQDYEHFYEMEDKFRKYMIYPPYSDLFQIIFTSEIKEEAEKGAQKWHLRLKELLGNESTNLFEPQEAYMSKIRDIYRYSLLIKCPKGKRALYTSIVGKVRDEDIEAARKKKNKYIAIVDINPYSFS